MMVYQFIVSNLKSPLRNMSSNQLAVAVFVLINTASLISAILGSMQTKGGCENLNQLHSEKWAHNCHVNSF